MRNVIRKVLGQLRENRPQTDILDLWNYLQYYGFKDLNLTEQEKEELRAWGNPIAEIGGNGMTKNNKVLEALIRIKNRIETDVVHFRRSDEEYEIEFYDAKGVDKVLREETNKAIRDKDE